MRAISEAGFWAEATALVEEATLGVIEAGPWAGAHPRVPGSTAICALRVKAPAVPSASGRVGRLGGLPLRHCVHSLKR